MASNHPYHRSGLGRALLAALAFVVGGASAFASGTQYYMNDHLATTVGIADAAGEIAALEADAFGSPVAAGANPGRYTGKPYDADMGAYVFPFRNYRAEEGRWMTADPSGFPDGVNANVYVPVPFMGLDPWGLATFTITMSISSPEDGATYTYVLTNPPPLNIALGHTVNISVTGTRTADESSLYTLKRSLHVDGSMKTNEALNLEFGTQTTRTWQMNISNYNVFFAADSSSNGDHSSTAYAQVFLGQTAQTTVTSKTVNYKIHVE